MKDDAIFYRRNLPHIHPKDGTFFITFLLAGAISAYLIRKIISEKTETIKLLKRKFSDKILVEKIYNTEKIFFGKLDGFLDSETKGTWWLSKDKLSQIVANKIHDLDGIRYGLICYTIMSNHVHIIINTTGINESTSSKKSGKTKNYPLADTMRLLKGSTARLCNIALSRRGAFWHHESYDRFIRDEEELNRIIQYTLNNPVKAGFVADWRSWKFTYLAEA